MKYFTGIDVSLRFVSICVIDEAGIVQHATKVMAEVDSIVTSLRRFSAEIKQLGLEAGTLTQYLTYGLQRAGYEVVCLDARQTAAPWPPCVTRPTATMPAGWRRFCAVAGTDECTSRASRVTRCVRCWPVARRS